MNNAEFQKLLETSWRRPLLPEEESRLQAWLDEHPNQRARWSADAALNTLLARQPALPISSNFTARVLAAVTAGERAGQRAARRDAVPWWRRRWLPRLGWAAALMVLGAVGVRQYQVYQRAAEVREIAQLPLADLWSGPELFEDFDAIHQLRALPVVSDEDLLVVLQ